MPDQSSASSEHALMREIAAPLENLPDNPVPAVAEVDFPLVLRGYDRLAVDAYVRKTSQLVAELQATRSPDAAIRRALERVGGEVSGILQRAHETAGEITANSRVEAEDRLETARREAAEITATAEERLKVLDAETDRIWEERLKIVEDARSLARQLEALADSATERFPAEELERSGGASGGRGDAVTAEDTEEQPGEEGHKSAPIVGSGLGGAYPGASREHANAPAEDWSERAAELSAGEERREPHDDGVFASEHEHREPGVGAGSEYGEPGFGAGGEHREPADLDHASEPTEQTAGEDETTAFPPLRHEDYHERE